MGRPKKKRKPARRRKSVNEGRVPVDRNEPKNWGGADPLPGGRTRVCNETTAARLLRTHAITPAQSYAWDQAQRIHERFNAAQQARVSSYGETGGGYSDSDPDWFVTGWPIYRAWFNTWPDKTFSRDVIEKIILGGLTIKAFIEGCSVTRPRLMKCLLALLDDLSGRMQKEAID